MGIDFSSEYFIKSMTLEAISLSACSVSISSLPNKSFVKPITPPELIKISGIKIMPF